MKNIELKIEGMHCTGCSMRLEKVLNNLNGIQKASVNIETGKANIEFDEKKTSIQDIKLAIEDAGFKGE